MKKRMNKCFSNGSVYALETDDGYPIEVTDTFLPYYTKDAVGIGDNRLRDNNLGDRSERWMVGVSCMSGCPVGCKFCATGLLPRWRSLSAEEIVDQVDFVVNSHGDRHPSDSKEFKINYTRMGEPFLNIVEVKKAISMIEFKYPGTHHYVSTIGVEKSDFSWIRGNITLQVSLHSLDRDRRAELIPVDFLMTIEELGSIRTRSNLKTTVNLTLVDDDDFNTDRLLKYFDPRYFFIKLSPINPNAVSDNNEMGLGVIESSNLALG